MARDNNAKLLTTADIISDKGILPCTDEDAHIPQTQYSCERCGMRQPDMLQCSDSQCFGAASEEYMAIYTVLLDSKALLWHKLHEPLMFPEYVQEALLRLRNALQRRKSEILNGGAMAIAAIDPETSDALVRVCRGDLNGRNKATLLKQLTPYLIKLFYRARYDIQAEELRQHGIDIRHQRYEQHKLKKPGEQSTEKQIPHNADVNIDTLRTEEYFYPNEIHSSEESYTNRLPRELTNDPWRDFHDEDEFNVWLADLNKKFPLYAQAVKLAREGYNGEEGAAIAECTVETFWKRKSLGCQIIGKWIKCERARRFPE